MKLEQQSNALVWLDLGYTTLYINHCTVPQGETQFSTKYFFVFRQFEAWPHDKQFAVT